MLIAFHTYRPLHTKRHSGADKTYSNFKQNFYFRNAPSWIKVICNVNKTNHTQTKNKSQKNKILKDKVYTSITEFHLIQKDQYHHLQKKTHI